jgi:uncharacterized membrane protein YqjE
MSYDNFRNEQFLTRKLYKREDKPKIIGRIYLFLGFMVWIFAIILGICILAVALLWDHFTALFSILLLIGAIYGIWRFNK